MLNKLKTIYNLLRDVDTFLGNPYEKQPVQAMYRPLGSMFTGEKQDIGMGPVKRYNVDYYTMADRAMDLFVTNEFSRAAISRVAQFAVGTGLTLHSEPQKDFLERFRRIRLDKAFSKEVETLWRLWSRDKKVSFDIQKSLDKLAAIVFINAFICGDVLVIKRIVNKRLQLQLVDGLNVYSSVTFNSNTGNEIINGVEID